MIDEYVRRPPHPALRGLVGAHSGWRQVGVVPGVHRGLPSPWLTLILTLDEPLLIDRHPDPRQPGGAFDTLAGGLHTRPALIRNPGRQSGVQIAVHPLAARSLLGLPAGELAGQDVDAAPLLGPDSGELLDRLRSAAGWAERFRLLDVALLKRLDAHRRPAPELGRALTRLGRGDPVATVAAEVGWSTRRLSDRFATEVGLSPKTTARVLRFHRARWRLQTAGPAADLATLAADCGYYDQSHLTRDFREFTGLAPTHWWAAEHGPADPSTTAATDAARMAP